MISIILNQFILLLGVLTVLTVLRLLLGYELKEKKTVFAVFSTVIIVLNLSLNICIRDTEITEMVTESLLMCSAMGLPYLLFRSKKKLSFLLFGLILCSTFDYLESLAISVVSPHSSFAPQIVYTALYGLALLSVVFIYRFGKMSVPPDFLEQISPTIYVVIFFADYSAYYDFMLSRDSQFLSEVSNVLKMLSAALIVASFSYIIYRYTNLSYKQREAEIQLEAELRHYEEMVQKNKDIRAFRHDYKNNLYSIKTLISSGRAEEAEKYIDELNIGVELSENRFVTGNYLADAIISGKADEAEKSGIKIAFDGMIPDKKIANSDLCTILSNSLDNAVRGCSELAPCTVSIKSESLPNGILLTISNPVKEKVAIKNNSVKTTKSDSANHGIGIKNIRQAAEKYNGYADISCSEKEFKIEIGLIF